MKKFITNLALYSLCIMVLLWALIVYLPDNSKSYLQAYFVKIDMLKKPQRSPSIVLLGGSNVAFSYDSGILADSTRMPVINAGLHAGLGLKFIFDDCINYLKKGDILVLSSEYSHYYDNGAYGDTHTDLFYRDVRHFLPQMNFKQLWSILNNTPFYIRKKAYYALSSIPQFHFSNPDTFGPEAFNSYGDFVLNEGSSPHLSVSHDRSAKINKSYICHLAGQVHELREKGIRVILLPPVYWDRQFEFSKDEIYELSAYLETKGLGFACDPQTMAYGITSLYDSIYHLNRTSARVHSMKIGHILKEQLEHI